MQIEYGKYYHIFNRGINSQLIFKENKDNEHFLNLMSIYLEPIADIYAYALMGNHFHIALRIKEKYEIGYLRPEYAKSEELDLKWKTFFPKDTNDIELKSLKKPVPFRMIQHLLIAYAKKFNYKYDQTGSLFEYKFKRILIENEKYLKQLIIYIHNNPVKHGICEDTVEYAWTSYLDLVSIKPKSATSKTVLGWFDDKANFIFVHKKEDDDDINFLDIEI